MKKNFIILGLILLGGCLTACGGGPTDTSNYHPWVVFAEDWKSYPVGDFPGGGWRDSAVQYNSKIVQIPDNHKMFLDGPSLEEGFYGAIYYDFKPGTMKPIFIRYNMHPYPMALEPGNTTPPYKKIGVFQILGTFAQSENSLGIRIDFRHDGEGKGYIVASSAVYPGSDQAGKIPIDKAFTIDLRNINWESNPITFDFWVNEVEVATCLQFTQAIDSITRITFSNFDYGRLHIGDIYMANLPLDYHCPVVSENPPGPENMPLPPPPTPTRGLVFFDITLNAFCRLGPGMDYPILSVFPEGARLTISGQNIEGTWWWSEQAGCWISDAVGELQGNRQSLEILIPPPPPEDGSTDDSPGQSGGCHFGLGKAACIEEGGTWDDQPGQPGTCLCP